MDDAAELLQELDARYPHQPDVLIARVEAFGLAGALEESRAVADRLVREYPRDPRVLRAQIIADIRATAPATALERVRAFLEAHPHDGWAPTAATLAEQLADLVRDAAASYGIAPDDAPGTLRLHEKAAQLTATGRLLEARRAVAELLRRAPRVAVAVNNLALLEWTEGHRRRALDTARQAVAIDAANVFARALLVRCLFLLGDLEAASAEADALRVAPLEGDDHESAAIAFSWLGDDDAVLACLSGAQAAARTRAADPPSGLLLHLGAVAAARGGDQRRARQLWRAAQRHPDAPEHVHAQLADLKQPAARRHGPWAFDIDEWIDDDLLTRLDDAIIGGDERALARGLRKIAKARPELARLVPAILDRAPPAVAITILQMLDDEVLPAVPGTSDAVVRFTLGQRGSDQVRMRASQVATRLGWLANGEHRMWLEGRWQTVLLMGTEIHGEPLSNHPHRVVTSLKRGMTALRDGDLETAERLLEDASRMRPDAPDVMNNMAVLRQAQGRLDAMMAITHAIHAAHPDYLFARATLAGEAARHGRLDEARDLVAPLLRRTRLHYSEARALVSVQITIAYAEGDALKAKRWEELGEAIETQGRG